MWTPNTGTASGLLFPVWASTAEIRIAYTGSESLPGTWLLAALCCYLSCSVLIERHHQPVRSLFALHTRSAELLKNPQTENNRYPSIHLHSDAGYRAGRAGSSAAPFPERGFAASWHSQRRILMSAEGSWPLHPAGRASSTRGTCTGQRQMQAVHSYRWPLSNADNAFSLS